MKKNKLFTILAAATLLTGTGTSLMSDVSSSTVQAAKKSKKKVKKSKKRVAKKRTKKAKKAKYATVRIKRGAVAYKVGFNKNYSKVTKIAAMKRKGKKQAFRGGKASVLWSTKYKKTNYYFLGGGLAVRAKDAKKTNKVKISSFSSLIKKAQDNFKKKVSDIMNQANALAPKGYAATVNKDTSDFFTYNKDSKKFEISKDSLTANTAIYVLYVENIKSNSGSDVPFYYAMTSDNKQLMIPKEYVTLKDANAKVPDEKTFADSMTNYKNAVDNAKKQLNALGVKTK